MSSLLRSLYALRPHEKGFLLEGDMFRILIKPARTNARRHTFRTYVHHPNTRQLTAYKRPLVFQQTSIQTYSSHPPLKKKYATAYYSEVEGSIYGKLLTNISLFVVHSLHITNTGS